MSAVTELLALVSVKLPPLPKSAKDGATIAPIWVALPVVFSVSVAPAPLRVSPSSILILPLPAAKLALMPALKVIVPTFVP